MVAQLEVLWRESETRTVEGLDAFIDGTEPDARRAAAMEWAGMVQEEATAGLTHLLWVARTMPVSTDSPQTGADVLRGRYRSSDARFLPTYERALEALGREMLPPFDVRELSIALTGLANGLEMRRAVDEESVRHDLYGDLLTALVIAITRPVGERTEETALRTVGDQTVVRPAASRDSPPSTWRQIAEAAAPLFASRSVNDVRVAEIAEVAGVSSSTVYHQFGSVSAVAAAGWVRHLSELEAIASQPLTATEGPIVRMEQVLTRLIQLARENRGALEGLVLQGVARAADGAPTAPPVPMSALLVPHIRELRTRGLLRRRIGSEGLARSIVQLTVMRVLNAPDEPDERIIDDSLGILLEGALAREGR